MCKLVFCTISQCQTCEQDKCHDVVAVRNSYAHTHISDDVIQPNTLTSPSIQFYADPMFLVAWEMPRVAVQSVDMPSKHKEPNTLWFHLNSRLLLMDALYI